MKPKDSYDLLAPPSKEFVDSLALECGELLYHHYFRCEMIHSERIPHRKKQEGTPRIFIANHSGMAFPWDAMMLGYGLGEKILKPTEQREPENMPRSLTAPALSHMPQMAPFFLPGWWKTAGCVDATFSNFEELLQKGHDIIIYPEGVAGIGKGFNKRYRLQRFSTSVVKLAIKYKASIVPICVINGEFINPLAYNVEWVNDFFRSFGIPYLPVGPLTPIVGMFPFMFYGGMPAQINFLFCEPVSILEWTGNKNYQDFSEEDFKKLSHQLRKYVQKRLIKGVRKYGQSPFKIGNFLFHFFFKAKKKRLHLLPILWPDLFLTHWHKFHGGKVDFISRFKRSLPYLTPILGWILLLIQNWPRILQKGKTIRFAMSKRDGRKNQ